jgi:F420-dependent oxidoreductase-like protein
VEIALAVEAQQGATYADLLAAAQEAEACGFTGFFRSDHLLRIGPGDPGPGATEAFATLAGLACQTRRIRLGTLVTPVTFRRPALLAATIATVDAMSGGRLEVGLGAGSYAREHEVFGLPFDDPGTRFDDLEETLTILRGLWTTPAGSTFEHAGRRHALRGAPTVPRPVQRPGVPVIIGGTGPRRTAAIAARYADEYNAVRNGPDRVRALFDGVTAACERVGRDPATLRRSVVHTGLVARDAADGGRLLALAGRGPDEVAAGSAVAGRPEEVAESLRRLAAAGADRVYLHLREASLFDQVALLGEHVLPLVRDVVPARPVR